MTSDRSETRLVTGLSAREHFHDSVLAAMGNQRIEAEDGTVSYVVNLLDNFMHSEELFGRTAEGHQDLKPLAFMYGSALESPTEEARNAELRRLGDVALFIAGVFADSLSRKPIDVGYYVAMGGTAYGYLAETVRGTLRYRAFRDVFGELSLKFQAFVDVLGEVSEQASLATDRDVMRLYEVWTHTGSPRAAHLLRKAGIEPFPVSPNPARH